MDPIRNPAPAAQIGVAFSPDRHLQPRNKGKVALFGANEYTAFAQQDFGDSGAFGRWAGICIVMDMKEPSDQPVPIHHTCLRHSGLAELVVCISYPACPACQAKIRAFYRSETPPFAFRRRKPTIGLWIAGPFCPVRDGSGFSFYQTGR